MHRPDPVDPVMLADFFATTEVLGASATTADGTQRKRLVRRGNDYVVTRKYVEGSDPAETVYLGADLPEAVRRYNGLG